MLKQVGTRIPDSVNVELGIHSNKINTSSSKILRYALYRFLVDLEKESRLNESDKIFLKFPNEYMKALDGVRIASDIDIFQEALKTMKLDYIPFVKDEAGKIVEIDKNFAAEIYNNVTNQENIINAE